MLIQYFYLGLTKSSRESLDLTSGGAFLHFHMSKARAMLEKVALANSELPEVEKDLSPELETEDLVAKLQSRQSQDLAVNPVLHFHDEISNILYSISNESAKDHTYDNIAFTSLKFRLLRENGFPATLGITKILSKY